MTCIVGIENKGTVYIGADSAGVAGSYVSIRADEKVFINGPFIIGFAGSFRAGQLLRFKFIPPAQANGIDDYRFMATDFIDTVRKTFTDNGATGSKFLVGYKGKLYFVDIDFQVGKPATGYDSVGSGNEIAMGALYATSNLSPIKRINIALEASSNHTAGVSPPFNILKSK